MKKALSILLSGILLMAVITAIPFTASAATDRVIDLSKSVLVTKTDTTMNYDEVDGILTITAKQYSGGSKPISEVGKISTWCKEIALKYADGTLAKLENGKRYAVTLNYTFVDNNGNTNSTNHQPQIAIGHTTNTQTTSAGKFYAAAVRNHKLDDAKTNYYLSAEITGNDNYLRIGFSGLAKFQINSVFLQEIDATAENQVTVVYCDGGEYKAEFETEGGALKTPVKDGMAFAGWYSKPDFSEEKVTTATKGAVLYAKWIDLAKSDLKIDLSKSKLKNSSAGSSSIKYDTNSGELNLSARLWSGKNGAIGAVDSTASWCDEIVLMYADGTLAKLESGKKYAVTLNYEFVDNNNNSSEGHLPQIAIGYDSNSNASATSAGKFYVAAVKNHAKAEAGSSYYLTAEITGSGKPLRIGSSGLWNCVINSILLQEINAATENQVTVVYCDEGEYKAEFAEEGGALKTPVKDGMAFAGWYLGPDFSGAKVTTVTAGAVVYAKWINPIEGDLNEDEVADIRDLVMLKEAVINQDTDMKYDLDGDSKPATKDDLLFLKKLLLGITV